MSPLTKKLLASRASLGKGMIRERKACNASTPRHPGVMSDVMSDRAQHTPAGQRQRPPPGGFLGMVLT